MEDHEQRAGGPEQPRDDSPPPGDAPRPDPAAWEQGVARRIEVPGAPGFVFASMTARVAAYLVDGVVLILVALIPVITVEILMPGESDLKLFADAVVVIAVTWAYFVRSWRSGARATPGQRLMKIRVGNAFDGRVLTIEQATSRWFALAFPFNALTFVPAIADVSSGLLGLWNLVLLIATAMSATRQGPHDRFARSAVVQRAGEGSSGVAVGCILAVAILGLVAVASIFVLIFLGAQMEEILRQVGDSI